MTQDSSSTGGSASAPPDVAAILTQLREEVRQRRQVLSESETYAAHAALERQLQRCVEQLELTRVVSAHWPLGGRSLFERIMALVNRLVRRYLRWYINPIVDQQNEFNDVAARTLRLLIESHADLREQLAVLEQNDVDRSPTHAENNDQHDGHAGGGGAHDGQFAGLCRTDHNKGGKNTRLFSAETTADAPSWQTTDLQALIEERGQHEPPASFPDIALRAQPRKLALHQHVNAHWHLEGDTLLQKTFATVHKTVRFYLRWLINPIVEQQNSSNAAFVEAVGPMLASDAELRAALAGMRARRVRG
jgi:hypothetical protein